MLLPKSLLLLPLVAAQSSLTLYHRFLPSPYPLRTTSDEPPFLPAGTLFNPQSLTSAPPDNITFDAAGAISRDDQTDDGEGWYQLAVQYPEDSRWLLTSTRSCFLPIADLQLVINFPAPSSHPVSISLSATPIPRSGACPPPVEGSTVALPDLSKLKISARYPDQPEQIHLISPPTIDTSTGLPAPPPAEKSFLQKYWLPIIGVAIFVAGQLGKEDKPRGGGGGAGAGAGGGIRT